MSYVHYEHRLYRSITMFRGSMVAVIYDRSLQLRADAYDESAAVTLMSTDTDRICDSIQSFHEIWARLTEVAIGITLLALQLGWVCIMPIIIVLGSTGLSSMVAKRIGGRQKIWTAAIQRRIAIVSSALGSMKSLKMMGLGRVMTDIIQGQRIRQLSHQKSFRWMIVWMNVVANIPEMTAPMATFTAYVIQAKLRGMGSLGTTQAFTSLAIISLLTTPAARLLAVIPSTASASGCFERIQAFLLAPSREDNRVGPGSQAIVNEAGDIPLQALSPIDQRVSITANNASFRPSPDSDFTLRAIDLSIHSGSTTMIVGPVGSGKTTLLKAILGEVPCHEGTIQVNNTRMAYCAQTPWLQNCSIQQSICGPARDSVIDIQWYEKVLRACALDQDIITFPQGDQSIIGSRGITLSGGQKQRVALARAVYSRHSVIVLDDVFSALDARTERMIIDRLFKVNGLFRQLGATVILVTHASTYSLGPCPKTH